MGVVHLCRRPRPSATITPNGGRRQVCPTTGRLVEPYADGLAVGLVKTYADAYAGGIGVPRGDHSMLVDEAYADG